MFFLSSSSSRHVERLAGLAFVTLMLAACSGGADSTPTSPASQDPSGSGTGSADEGKASEKPPAGSSNDNPQASTGNDTKPPSTGACNTLDNDAAAVGADSVATSAPVATGGNVPDGKYHLTSVKLYTGKGGSSGPIPLSIKQTIELAKGTVNIAEDANGKVSALTQTYTIKGTSIAFAQSCPAGTPGKTVKFSADGTKVSLYIPNDLNQITEFTYEP